ncbi:SIS domain-containing protein [Chloroflexota bacterium]
MDIDRFIISELTISGQLLDKLASESASEIRKAGELLLARLAAGGKVLIFGNGGSAADAQHFVSELVGRYRLERAPFPAVALTTDPSTLTSISNDYGFSEAFARPVQALAQPGDVVVGISTSGRSTNVIAGLQAARNAGANTVALIGANILGLAALADVVISVPSEDTPRIQEMHGVIIHILCDIIEQGLVQRQKEGLPAGSEDLE